MALNEQLTVVLISHERPAFLRRAVRFYSALPCRILVLDSSAEALPGVAGQFANVEYQHLPQFVSEIDGAALLADQLDRGIDQHGAETFSCDQRTA